GVQRAEGGLGKVERRDAGVRAQELDLQPQVAGGVPRSLLTTVGVLRWQVCGIRCRARRQLRWQRRRELLVFLQCWQGALRKAGDLFVTDCSGIVEESYRGLMC